MAQDKKVSLGDILFDNANSGTPLDPDSSHSSTSLPTREGILNDLGYEQESGQASSPNQSEDASHTDSPTTESDVESGESTVEEKPAAEDPQKPEKPAPAPAAPVTPPENWTAVQTSIGGVERNIQELADSYVRIAGEVREMHKLYHTEYASRLKSMQDELERYREIEKGRIFDGILGDIARLYNTYESLVDEAADEKEKKGLRYMLEDILQILEANGVFKQKSNPGDKRNTRHCQVINRVPTALPEQHDTVVRSCGTGFFIENRSLIRQPVEIYIYSKTTEEKSVQN